MCTAHFRWLFLDSHQMSAPVGSGGGLWSEQIWTGLKWWPPDVTSREGVPVQ